MILKFFLYLGYSLFYPGIIHESQNLNSYNFSARYYDFKIGQFLSADPITPNPQSHQGLNRYAYTFNNPLKYDDPDGHTPNERSKYVRNYQEAQNEYIDQTLASLGYTSSSKQNTRAFDAARISQGASFGTREALRLGFAFENISGESARILHTSLIRNFEVLENMRPTVGLLELGMGNEVTAFVDAVSDRTSMSVADKRKYLDILLEDARKLGFRAGVSQTSVLFFEQTPKTWLNFGLIDGPKNLPKDYSDAIKQGLINGGRITASLNVIGGGLGIWSALEYENDLAKILGITGGGLEIAAGLEWSINTHALMNRNLNRTASLAVGTRLFRARALGAIGGPLGLIGGAMLEYAASQDHPPLSEEGREYLEQNAEYLKNLDGCKGNFCLVEGTQVWTSFGLKKIEEIKAEDFVSSSITEAKVVSRSENKAEAWLQIKTLHTTLNLTKNHPIKVKDRGWILAGEISAGDYLVTHESNQLAKNSRVLEIKEHRNPVKIYNLEVEPINEFYVTPLGILVRGLAK